jgi:hypothetical protein
MRILLRLIAIFIAVAVALTCLSIVQFAFRGGLRALLRSPALGFATIAAWLIILTAGPVAAVQLWRLRRVGLVVAATLCGTAFTYYVVGLLFLRTPEAPLTPIFGAIVVNGLLLALLLSPAARGRVS